MHLHQRVCYGNSVSVKFSLNDNSEVILATNKDLLPSAFHANCFSRLVHTSACKHKNVVCSETKALVLRDNLVNVGKSSGSKCYNEASRLLEEKHQLQK